LRTSALLDPPPVAPRSFPQDDSLFPPIPGLEESKHKRPIHNLVAPEDPSSSEEDEDDLYGIAFDAHDMDDDTWER
jgi:hypothetical protein